MNIDNIIKHIKWEEYYDPNFNWDNWEFYHNNTLSEKFIKEFIDKVNWRCISLTQSLSNFFIKKYANKLDWYLISRYRKLSEKFIEDHKDQVCWAIIFERQKLSNKFKAKWKDKMKCISFYFGNIQ